MIVNADLFDCLDFIPDGYFDLIIIDPPYNLDKDFHGRKFAVMKTDAYEEFLRSWFYRVCDKLKPDGSLYMCGDWKCTSSMQRVIEERLTVVNRISWQREKGRGAKANWKNSMEDIWFAVKNPRDYYFDVDSVKMKRKVIAPYREDGRPKDWEETEMYRCHVHFYLIGHQHRVYEIIKEMPPMEHFTHEFEESGKPDRESASKADVILLDLQGMECRKDGEGDRFGQKGRGRADFIGRPHGRMLF